MSTAHWQRCSTPATTVIGITACDVVSCTHSTAFDFSVFEIFAAWSVGAQVVLVDHETVRDPRRLWDRLVSSGVTVLSQTPSAFIPLSHVAIEAGTPGCLRKLVFGGEALDPTTLRRWRAVFGEQVSVTNMYGLTEATVHVTAGEVDPADPRSLIGLPIGDCTAQVLDRWLRPVPVGVWGELYVAGTQVAQGYWAQAPLTANRFVAAPGGRRRYRTGDIARYTSEGVLEYRGRRDHQVQLRGYRIELDEIAAVIRSVPGVVNAVVAVTGRADGGTLVAYLETSTASAARDAERVCADTLPAYQLPSHFEVLEQLPLTPSGKVDRAALPAPSTSAPTRIVDTPALRAIVDAVAQVLEVDAAQIDPSRSLFQLGVSSLTAMRLAVVLGREAQGPVSVRDLVDAPDLSAIATLSGAWASTAATAEPVREYVPTPQQQGLWLLHRYQPASAAYHIPVRIPLTSSVFGVDLTPAIVQSALYDLADRHEALRTRLPQRDGGPVAVILDPQEIRETPETALVTHVVDRSDLDTAIEAEATRPFDLTTEVGWRAAIFADSGGRGMEMVLVAHHAFADLWSAHLLVTELMTAVRARAAGDAPVWPSPVQHYSDHAMRSAAEAAGAQRERSLDYWTRQLAGAPTHLDLPHPPAATREGGPMLGESAEAIVSAADRDRLAALAEGLGGSLFHLIHLATAAVVAQFTGESDVVIGTAVAGRTTSDDLTGVGMYVQTVVLRSADPAAVSLAQAFDASRVVVTDAVAHSALSYEEMITALAPERTAASDPYLDVLLAYQELPAVPAELAGARVSTGHARVPVEVSIAGRGKGAGLEVLVTVGTRRVDPAAAPWLAAAFGAALTALARLDPSEPGPLHHRLGREAVVASVDHHTPVIDPIEAITTIAQTRGHARAVSDGARTITYCELVSDATSLADELHAHGIGPGDSVAVIVDRSAAAVIATVGVLWAGAAYVPIDTTYPRARITASIADSGSVAVITDAAGLLAEYRHQSRTPLDGGLHVAYGVREHRPVRRPPRPADAAYTIYTSGSTGQPKGVTVSRASLAAMLGAALASVDAGPDDVWTWSHSHGFDVSAWEIFGALSSGGRLIAVGPETARDPAAVCALIGDRRVTIVSQTPTAFALIADRSENAAVHEQLTSLRRVVLAGEALDPVSLAPWAAAHSGAVVLNMYGPTETTVYLTCEHVDTSDPRSIIGGPLPGVGMALLDRYLRPVGVGARGEIYVFGPQVADGYHGRPDLTAERFVACPWNPGQRMYRTGDLARRVDATRVEYLGRSDRQVQIRGYRIEPDEVAAVLRAQAGVVDVRVLVRPGVRAGDESLVAFLVGERDCALDPPALRTACAVALPAHLVPAQCVLVDEWPLTTSGKLDESSLLARSATGPDIDRELTPLEGVVAGIVGVITGTTPGDLAPTSNFFAVGGNSLSAARLASALGEGVSVRDVFDHPTIAMLATLIAGSGHEISAPAITAVDDDARGRIPITPQQHDLWMRWQLHPEDTGYNMAAAIPVGETPAESIESALRWLISRHAALRTSYPSDARGPFQLLRRPEEITLDLTPRLVSDHRGEVDRMNVPFDLSGAVPWRVALVETGAADSLRWLVIVAHHIMIDGQSVGLLEADLRAYRAGMVPTAA